MRVIQGFPGLQGKTPLKQEECVMQQTVKHMRDSGMRHAKAVRSKARAGAMMRKEEYLGARVPKELRDKVIAQADMMGIPVSILIRNILEEAFRPAISGVRSESGTKGVGQGGITGNHVQGNNAYPTVIGWEVMTLNRTMTCSGCGGELKPGTAITLGLASPGEDHVILCGKCKKPA